MRKVGGIVCGLAAVPLALVTMLFAAGAADPDASTDAWALTVAAILGLAAMTGLLGVLSSALRSARAGTWRTTSAASYWLVLALSLALVVAEIAVSALDELNLDALYLASVLGLVVSLTLLTLERLRWGLIAAGALSVALAAVTLPGA